MSDKPTGEWLEKWANAISLMSEHPDELGVSRSIEHIEAKEMLIIMLKELGIEIKES